MEMQIGMEKLLSLAIECLSSTFMLSYVTSFILSDILCFLRCSYLTRGGTILKKDQGVYSIYRNQLYSPGRGEAKVSYFSVNVIILKSGPSPLDLPHF